MTSHADTLRKHAAGYTGLRGYEDLAAAAIAGAEALDTLTKVRKVAELLDQMAEDSRKLTHLDWARNRAEGQAHAYAKAAEFIRDALGGTP